MNFFAGNNICKYYVSVIKNKEKKFRCTDCGYENDDESMMMIHWVKNHSDMGCER